MIAFGLPEGRFHLFPLLFKLSTSQCTGFLSFALLVFSPAPLQGLEVSKQLRSCFAGRCGQPTTVLFGTQRWAGIANGSLQPLLQGGPVVKAALSLAFGLSSTAIPPLWGLSPGGNH